MIVELDDMAFRSANDGDLFTIQLRGKKKYCKPLSKQRVLDEERSRIVLLENQVEYLINENNNIRNEIINFKHLMEIKMEEFIITFCGTDVEISKKEGESNETNI